MGLHFRLVRYLLNVCFIALCLATETLVAQVVVTVTGTVDSGTNGNPNSNPPGAGAVFGGASDLTGDPFTLTMNFDPLEGTNSFAYCSDGTLNQSSNHGSDTAGPTGFLQIGGGSYAFGTVTLASNNWLIYRQAPTSCTGYNDVGFSLGETYGGTYSGVSGLGGVNLYATSPNFTSGDWRSAIPTTPIPVTNFQFNISLTSIAEDGTRTLTAYAFGYLNATSVTVSGLEASNPLDKDLGACRNAPGQRFCGNPINIGNGNKYQEITDYSTAGQNKLSYTRYYNSLGKSDFLPAGPGGTWRTTYSRTIQNSSATSVAVYRADGQVLPFTLNAGVWTSDTDVDVKLTQSGGTWTLTDTDDTVETYTAATANIGGLAVPYGQLASIQSRNGYMQTLNYGANNALLSVTDSYSRTLTFAYNAAGQLQTVTTPDATTITYSYSATSPNLFSSVTYPTIPATSQTYLYENALVPTALTGIIDENGNRFATWTYDGLSRGLSSQHAGGADLTTISYDDTTGNRTVTTALGQQELYKFTTLQNVAKAIEIDRLATGTTAAATEKFTYDANGYVASRTDWNGNLTTFVNDVHGQPTTMVEASGTAQARTTTTIYHPTFHLPLSIATPGLTTTFTYDAAGELLTKTLADTTVTIVPYSTNGTSRVGTYTWANFLLASAQGPRTDVAQLTGFTYDASGAITKVTNALGQSTQITAHSGGGLPETIVDLNGVTTTLTYNARQWLLASTLSTTAGPLTTTLAYDAAGNLVKTTLPDGSALTNSYDAAHRLTGVTDLFNQSVSYTLDANGDRTQTNILNSASAVQRQHSDTFDALGRTLDDIGGAGQTTAYALDANGNALTVTDPLGHVTQQAFDALNRIIRVIDAASGIAKITYDTHDRPVTVVDPNSGSTTFVYDGFGDVIQRISPDTGKTVYRYDLASNVTQSVDATSTTTNYAYDALNRVLATTYPADAAENVAYGYDQAGHGFGIGRLTSVTDAAGTLSRSFDERGNILAETRVHGTATLVTSTTYDPASRVASITYPSGWNIAYTRDVMGRITAMNAKSPAGVTQSIASAITYQPFGPVNALAYGNGIAEARSFDLDYRLLNLSDTGTAALQNLTYTYNADNNVSKLADGVTAANTQNLGYDVLDHLTAATGNYGALGYTYSAIGNMLTQTSGGVLSNYTYAPHSNQLASIKTGAATQTVGTTAAGNISSFAPAFGTVTSLTYNQANRLATASSGAGQLAQYMYDGFGRRIVKVGSATATTIYQYDRAGHLLEENDGAGNTKVDYIYLNDRPVATIEPSIGAVYFLHGDRLGTPQLATDASQTVQWSATYQPFGTTSTGVGLIVQNLRLPGQEFDLETGLYHNGFRDYIPGVGRYAESDPIGLESGMNTYQYVLGNPITHTDMLGLETHEYSRPTNITGPFSPINYLGYRHYWLKTDTEESGMGGDASAVPGQGNADLPLSPVQTVDHTGQSQSPDATEVPIPFPVDEQCVNRLIKPGQPLGLFLPYVNDCQSFATGVLNQCRIFPPNQSAPVATPAFCDIVGGYGCNGT